MKHNQRWMILCLMSAAMGCSAGGASQGEESDIIGPGGAQTASCEFSDGMPAALSPSDITEVITEGPYFFSYQLEYGTEHTKNELEHWRSSLSGDGWEVFSGSSVDSQGWEFLSLLAVRSHEVISIDTLGEAPFTADFGYSGIMNLHFGQFPRSASEMLLSGLVLPADASITQLAWTTSVHGVTFVFETATEYREYQQLFEANLQSAGLDWNLTYDQQTGLTYISGDGSIIASVTPLSDGRLMVDLADRTCLDG